MTTTAEQTCITGGAFRGKYRVGYRVGRGFSERLYRSHSVPELPIIPGGWLVELMGIEPTASRVRFQSFGRNPRGTRKIPCRWSAKSRYSSTTTRYQKPHENSSRRRVSDAAEAA